MKLSKLFEKLTCVKNAHMCEDGLNASGVIFNYAECVKIADAICEGAICTIEMVGANVVRINHFSKENKFVYAQKVALA